MKKFVLMLYELKGVMIGTYKKNRTSTKKNIIA